MQHLSDYSAAYDAEADRQQERVDAIDAWCVEVIDSRDALVEQIKLMIERDEIQPAELIAYLYASRIDPRARPEWFRESTMEYAIRNLEANINEALGSNAAEQVDAARAEHERNQREGSVG
jgi:hypothetical protein